MEKPLVLVADSSFTFQKKLAGALNGDYRVRTCGDGREALTLLRELRPAILVLDLMLAEKDGLSVLEAAAAEGLTPIVLATAPLLNAYIQENAVRLGISYLMRQPCDAPAAADRVRDLDRHFRAKVPSTQSYLSGILKSLGFCATHRGSRILPGIIELAVLDPEQSLTKELYPEAVKRADPPLSVDQMEKLIRYATKYAWENGDPAAWHRYFPKSTRPTSRAFIFRMAEALTEWKRRNLMDFDWGK